MAKILVQIGFGYYKDQQDHIVAKAELPLGPHNLDDGLVYIEVANKAELEAIKIYKDPTDVQLVDQEQKVQQKLRQIAIAELTKDGNWP